MHGFGHVSRCVTLAEAFVSEGLGAPVFQTFSPDGAARKFIADRGFSIVDATEGAGGTSDLEEVRGHLENMVQPRLLVIDSRDISSDYCRSCKDLAVTLCFDDEECRDLACDIIVNNHPWVRDDDYASRPDRLCLTGPVYNTISPAIFRDVAADSLKDVRRILITLGGEDPHDHTSWIVRSCAELLSSYDVDVIVGPAHPNPNQVKATVSDCLPAANLVTAPSGLGAYILKSDIAVSAGGITCYELAAAGVPTLAVAVEDHQEALVASLENHGALVRLGGHKDLRVDRVQEMLAQALNNDTWREKMSSAAKQLFQSPGGPKIVSKAAEIVSERF